MKLHRGPPPRNDEFQPQEQGWSGIREPNPIAIQLLALPVAFLVFILLVTLIDLTVPRQVFSVVTQGFPLMPLLLALVVCIPVHELLHALSHPGLGRSPETIIGIWLSRGLFYAHYEGAMPRNRFLWVFAAPFVLLSLAPLALIAALGRWLGSDAVFFLALLALVNGVASSGDIIGMLLIAVQVPPRARVRNKGWRSFWKIDQSNEWSET
jgi:hypothetical protein